ncbi:MAG: S41 family peptidase [Prevotellaceae bacterium]|jgi:carboxyl-terminal processing protease|nr:S41 family peptidase [Prevotellaceae bacterium]
MMNKNKFFVSALMLAMMLLSLYVGTRLGKVYSTPKIYNFSISSQNNLAAVIEYISKFYVDSVNIKTITEPMIVDILKELDPHSIYIPASELKSSNEHLEGNFEGIGVTFNMLNDTVIVINVIEGGPSDKAGVNPGDRIIVVNDSVIAGKRIANENIKTLLRGKAGSKVQIKVKREGIEELIPIDITRGKVILKSINVAYMITPNTGYIRLTGFAQNTHSEFVVAIERLHSEGMTNIIIDLRNNNGGFLDQAIKITNELFSDKKLIVYTEGQAFPRRNEYSTGNGKCGNDSLIVLIDEHSASASEILAGAVQDNDRGLIVGRRSFGKGLVQQMLDLPDKSGLRLTIARYYTPSGRSIQRPYRHGASGVVEYYNELYHRDQKGEYDSADSIRPVDTTKYYTSKGRIVYGGGGITPDTFVSYEHSGQYISKIIASRALDDYVLIFGDKHRNELNAITNFILLEQFFEKNDPYSEFDIYLKKRGFKEPDNGVIGKKESKKLLEMYLKTYISQITPLSYSGAAFLYNRFDKTVQKALEIINTKTIEANV